MHKEKKQLVEISDSIVATNGSQVKNPRIKTQEKKISFCSGFISGIITSIIASIIWDFISKLWN